MPQDRDSRGGVDINPPPGSDCPKKTPVPLGLKLHGSIVGTAFNYLTSYKNHFRSTILSDLKSILTYVVLETVAQNLLLINDYFKTISLLLWTVWPCFYQS